MTATVAFRRDWLVHFVSFRKKFFRKLSNTASHFGRPTLTKREIVNHAAVKKTRSFHGELTARHALNQAPSTTFAGLTVTGRAIAMGQTR